MSSFKNLIDSKFMSQRKQEKMSYKRLKGGNKDFEKINEVNEDQESSSIFI